MIYLIVEVFEGRVGFRDTCDVHEADDSFLDELTRVVDISKHFHLGNFRGRSILFYFSTRDLRSVMMTIHRHPLVRQRHPFLKKAVPF